MGALEDIGEIALAEPNRIEGQGALAVADVSNGIVERVVGDDGQNRTEQFFARDLHFPRDAGNDAER